jgi:hypothetical protein
MVKEVIEHISGEKVDVDDAFAAEACCASGKGCHS